MERKESGDIEMRFRRTNMNLGSRRGFSKSIQMWSDVKWHLVEERVAQLQHRIFKVSAGLLAKEMRGENVSSRQRKVIHQLQRHLLRSTDAKLLAVRQVSQLNQGAKTPGVDKIAKLSPQERLELAKTLNLEYTPLPIRGVDIPKPPNKTRPLGIPAMRDRATQALIKLALEPEWEARFESNSFGFRPGRNCHDATSSVWHSLKGTQKYVLDADISGCFDNINHDLLLEKLQTTKEIKTIVEKWLKSARVKGFFPKISPELINTPNLKGTPQGGVISPLLANICLHGMENAVREYYVKELYAQYGHTATTQNPTRVSIEDRARQISVIRYADDFVILHPSREVIIACKSFVGQWLIDNIGLELSPEKTSIVLSSNGFNFLGFHFISIKEKESGKFKCRVSVSRKAKDNLCSKTHDVLMKGRSLAQSEIIKQLNPIITGWCTYYSMHECTIDFKNVEARIFKQLQKWVLRRGAPGLQGNKLLANYFKEAEVKFRGKVHKGTQFCCMTKNRTGTKDMTLFWVKPSFINSQRPIKVMVFN